MNKTTLDDVDLVHYYMSMARDGPLVSVVLNTYHFKLFACNT